MTTGTGRGARRVKNLALVSLAVAVAAFVAALPGDSHVLAPFGGALIGPAMLVVVALVAPWVQKKGWRAVALHLLATIVVLAGFSVSTPSPEQMLLAFVGGGALLHYAELATMRLKFEKLQSKIRSRVTKSRATSRGVFDLDEVEDRLASSVRRPTFLAILLLALGLYGARPLFGTLSPAIGASLELSSLYGVLLGAGMVFALLVAARLLGLSFRVTGRLLDRIA